MANRIYAFEPNLSDRVSGLYHDYEQFMRSLIARKKIDLNKQLTHLVTDLQRLSDKYPDFLFCEILLDKKNVYSLRHPVLCALVCNMMVSRFKLDDDEAFALVASALTANAGMFKEMDTFAEQQEPLSRDQRSLVNMHPSVSVELLTEAEIENPLILETVLKHHEKLDGSGYPKGLKGRGITKLSSVLSLTDVFCAMLLPRKYRDGLYDKKAIQHVFQQRSEKINSNLVDHYIKEVGIYPPGVFVELNNAEEALVAARNPENASRPTVVSFAMANGEHLDGPIVRETVQEAFSIRRSVPPVEPPFSISRMYEALSNYEVTGQAG